MTKLKATAKEKLLKLADFLEAQVKDDWFNLNDWATEGFTKKKCGTTACALGWATVCFPRSKLCLRTFRRDVSLVYYTDSSGRKTTGYHAAAKFFGIEVHTATKLFDPHQYPSKANKAMRKKAVIKRLRECEPDTAITKKKRK